MDAGVENETGGADVHPEAARLLSRWLAWPGVADDGAFDRNANDAGKAVRDGVNEGPGGMRHLVLFQAKRN